MAFGTPSLKRSAATNRLGAIFRTLRSSLLWTCALTVVFVVFAWLSIPTQLLAWRAVQEAQTRGIQIEIDDLSISPWGRVGVKGLVWHFERTAAYQTTVPFVVNRLDVGGSPIAYLVGKEIDTTIQAALEEGQLSGTLWRAGKHAKISLDLVGLPLRAIPRLQQTFNAPLRGIVGLDAQITVDNMRLDKSNGVINVRCRGCGLGDGVTKLYVPDAKGMLANGFTAPSVNFGDLNGTIRLVNGVATLENVFFDGEDIKIKISGTIAFNKDIRASKLDLVFKIFVSPQALEREDGLNILVGSASSKIKLSGEDEGWLGYRLNGSLAHNRFRGFNSKTSAQALEARRQRRLQQRPDARAAGRTPRGVVAPNKPATRLVAPAQDDDDDDEQDDQDDAPFGGRMNPAGRPTRPERGGMNDLPAPPRGRPVRPVPDGMSPEEAQDAIEEARRNIRGDDDDDENEGDNDQNDDANGVNTLNGPGAGAGRATPPIVDQ